MCRSDWLVGEETHSHQQPIRSEPTHWLESARKDTFIKGCTHTSIKRDIRPVDDFC